MSKEVEPKKTQSDNYSKQSTQNPSEPARKNINRVIKEKKESDNPVKK